MRKLLIACMVHCLFNATAWAQKTNKVLIIGIDGCRPDALVKGDTPNIDKLITQGTYSWDALNEGITSSGPGWSSILTGVWENKHKVTNNSFNGNQYDSYPHFFSYVERHDPDLHTVSIAEWNPINNFIAIRFADKVINTTGPEETVNRTVSYLKSQDPDVLFVHLDTPDRYGHSYGFSPEIAEYVASIEKIDGDIGKIMAAVDSRPDRANEHWLVILTTDHGGKNTSHGGNSMEEKNVFVILSGDGVARQQIAKDSTKMVIEPVANCFQDSVELYFDATDAIQMPLNDALNFGNDQDFSVEVRVRTTDPADVSIVSNKDWTTGLNKGWVFSFKPSTQQWKVNVGDGNSRVDVNGNVISDGEWHMLSATFDRDGDLKIYENGTFINSVDLAGIGNIDTGLPLSIGADGLKAYAYDGYIAEVRIFNTLLDIQEINNWKCKPLDETHANFDQVLGYWRLNDGLNTEMVADLGPLDITGTISGATWQNALDSRQEWIYDYSNTPRQVDLVVNALEHLCIPVNPDWNLDGKVLGVTCTEDKVTGINDFNLKTSEINIYPNPVKGNHRLTIKGLDFKKKEKVRLVLHNSLGQTVFKKSISTKDHIAVDLKNIPGGIYTLILEVTSERIAGSVKIVITE